MNRKFIVAMWAKVAAAVFAVAVAAVCIGVGLTEGQESTTQDQESHSAGTYDMFNTYQGNDDAEEWVWVGIVLAIPAYFLVVWVWKDWKRTYRSETHE